MSSLVRNGQTTLNSTSLLRYLSQNSHILLKPRKPHCHIERIMAMLTHDTLHSLERQFRLNTRGLELPTFVYMMTKLYNSKNNQAKALRVAQMGINAANMAETNSKGEVQMQKYYFVEDVIKFFQAIDINGDGHLEWNEFTEYIIQNIRRVETSATKEAFYRQNEIISAAYSKISNQYRLTRVVELQNGNPIKKVIYVKKARRYFVLEAGCDSIQVFSEQFTTPVDNITLGPQTQQSNPLGVTHWSIVDFAVDRNNLILGVLFGNALHFCNLKVNAVVKSFHCYESEKMKAFCKLEYLMSKKLWAAGSKIGQLKLLTVNYRSRSNAEITVIRCIKQHDGLITQIIDLVEPQAIISSSIDGTVKYFFPNLGNTVELEAAPQQMTSIINSKHKKGILGLDICSDFGCYMLSFGFSTSVHVYNLEISLSKGFIGKYSQHSSNLLAARFLKTVPFALSFDQRLNMRVWDFRNFTTLQVLNCQKYVVNPSRLQIVPQLAQCLICDKKISLFRAAALEKKSKEINQFHSVFEAKICSSTNDLFLFGSNDVRVYDHLSGSLKNVFTKLSQKNFSTNITAAQFGYQSRKFFIGDAAGFLRQYCSQTGLLLQQIKPTEEPAYEHKHIIKILFLKQHSLLIACSSDGRIMAFERTSAGQYVMIRDIRDSHFELVCAAAASRYCLLATGDSSGQMCVWSLERFTLDKLLVFNSALLELYFSAIHPILLVMQTNGLLSCFHTPPQDTPDKKYQCFAKIDFQELNAGPIASISFDLIKHTLFEAQSKLIKGYADRHYLIGAVGTSQGTVLLLNLNTMLQRFSVQESHQMLTCKKFVHCQVQSVRSQLLTELKRAQDSSLRDFRAEYLSLSAFNNQVTMSVGKAVVQKVVLAKLNSFLVTSTSQKKIKVWSFEGQLLGVIDFLTFKKSQWKIGQLNLHRELQTIETTLYAIKLIENKRFTAREQETIKASLLMNYVFVDEEDKLTYLEWLRAQTGEKDDYFTNGFTKSLAKASSQPRLNSNKQESSKNIKDKPMRDIPKTDDPSTSFSQLYAALVKDIKQRQRGDDQFSYRTVLKPLALSSSLTSPVIAMPPISDHQPSKGQGDEQKYHLTNAIMRLGTASSTSGLHHGRRDTGSSSLGKLKKRTFKNLVYSGQMARWKGVIDKALLKN